MKVEISVPRFFCCSRKKMYSLQITPDEKKIIEEKLHSNYYLDDGVAKWPIIYPIAKGNRQSPIDIEPGRAHLDPGLKSLQANYQAGCVKAVGNTGYTFKVDVDESLASLTGGALEGEFRLAQFHAHWGTSAGARGSEHTVNGKLYDAELHLVHWNTKYADIGEAVSQPDGLAVIGVFLQVGEHDHPEFEKVIKVFREIHYKDMKVPLSEEIDPAKFLPEDMSYWFYPGSLTTPPLSESVLWHVLRTPISISRRQLEFMASLRTGIDPVHDQSCIVNNFRPPVSLGDRRLGLYTGEAREERPLQQTDDVLFQEVASLKQIISELKEDLLSDREYRTKL